MSDYVEIAPVADFPAGERYVVEVDGTVVCVRNVDGEFYAIEGTCAHRGGPICSGEVEAVADDSRRGNGTDLLVRCPWHGWEYDIGTGEQLGPAGASLATFAVVVEDGIVRVDADEIREKT
jgi:nitrite reductase/ring-hydroxylating ferredoxin subunit